jgi:hypothetical protein
MDYVAHGSGPRNTRRPLKSKYAETALTRGGKAVKRKRPDWSASLCNAAAELAGIGRGAVHG